MRKQHSSEEIVAKIRRIDILTSQGVSLAEALKTVGATKAAVDKWRLDYGGLIRTLGATSHKTPKTSDIKK